MASETRRCSSVNAKSISSFSCRCRAAHKPRHFALRAELDDGAVAVFLQDPSPAQGEVRRRRLVEHPHAGIAKASHGGIEVLHLEGHNDIAMGEVALAAE